MIKPKIIIIRGPLGIGKTTIAKNLEKLLDAHYISLDKVLKENKLDRQDGAYIPEDYLRANKIIIPIIVKSLAKGKKVILDGCFYFKEQLDNLEENFPTNLITINLKAKLETCISRDGKRKKVYGKEAAKVVYERVAKFDYGINVDTDNKTKDQVVKEILNILTSNN